MGKNDTFGLGNIDFGFGPQKKPQKKKRKNISFTEKAILWEKNKSHICHICRQKIHSLTEAEVDHIRAHSKGGQGVSWAHRACNRVKGKKSLSEIHRRLGIKSKTKRRKPKKKIPRRPKTPMEEFQERMRKIGI